MSSFISAGSSSDCSQTQTKAYSIATGQNVYSSSVYNDENQPLNHNCQWKKYYEEEYQKRIEAENSYIKYLKLEEKIKTNMKKVSPLLLKKGESVSRYMLPLQNPQNIVTPTSATISQEKNQILNSSVVQSGFAVHQEQEKMKKLNQGNTQQQQQNQENMQYINQTSQMGASPPSHLGLKKFSTMIGAAGINVSNAGTINIEKEKQGQQLKMKIRQERVQKQYSMNLPFQPQTSLTCDLPLQKSTTNNVNSSNMQQMTGRREPEMFFQPLRNSSTDKQYNQPQEVEKNNKRQLQRESERSVGPPISTQNSILHGGLFIDYRDNDPQLYNISEVMNMQPQKGQQSLIKGQALKKHFRSGDELSFKEIEKSLHDQVEPGFQFHNNKQVSPPPMQLQSQFEDFLNEHSQENTFQQSLYDCEQEIKSILKMERKHNLSFSKLRIIGIDGEGGHLEKVRLKQDPIRIVQKRYFRKLKQQKMKSGTFFKSNEDQDMFKQNNNNNKLVVQSVQVGSINGFAQLQPSYMLGRDEKYSINTNEFRRMNHEEDVIDCQEGNRTPFHQNLSKHSTKFQSQNSQNMMFFQSPKYSQQQKKNILDEEDMMMIETQRIMDDEQITSRFNDLYILETPAQRQLNQYNPLIDDSSFKKDFALKNSCKIHNSQLLSIEYDNDYVEELTNSLRNRSTVKKMKQSNLKAQKDSAVKQPSQQFLAVLEPKRFINPKNTIKEESQKQEGLNSDEEDAFVEQDLTACNESKEKSLSMSMSGSAGVMTNRLIKNPTYARITHASKQIPLVKGGSTGVESIEYQAQQTMGAIRKIDQSRATVNTFRGNPLLKSMPNLDFLRQIDSSQLNTSMPFEEKSSLIDNSNTMNKTFMKNEQLNDSIQLLDKSRNQIPKKGISAHVQEDLKRQTLTTSPSRFSTRRSHLFEEFFIIGVDKNELQSLPKSSFSTQSSKRFNPKTLYMHTQNAQCEVGGGVVECERRRVVKDFCFPEGIEVKELKKSESFSSVQKILYSSKSLRDSCFIFTLNATEEGISDVSMGGNSQNNSLSYMETYPGGSGVDKYYNCLCVVFNELITPKGGFYKVKGKEREKLLMEQKIYRSKKAFCFMFVNNFYQLHLDVINSLTNALKLERMRLQEEHEDNFKLKETIFKDIIAMLELPLITEEMKQILDEFHQIEYDDHLYDSQKISIDIGPINSCIQFEVPTHRELSYLDSYWFCPQLFSLFSLTDFLKLLSAILLEKSVVFVGKQGLISNTILGFNSLLYPFKWCLALVPILPQPLIEMLEAPLPLLVGITKREYKQLVPDSIYQMTALSTTNKIRDSSITQASQTLLEESEIDSKVWVFIEQGKIIWSKINGYEEVIPQFHFNNLQTRIKEDYEKFSVKNSQYLSQNLMAGDLLDSDGSSSRSSLLTDLDNQVSIKILISIQAMGSDEMKSLCKVICEKIRRAYKEYIFGDLKQSVKREYSRISRQPDNMVKEVRDIVCKKCYPSDREFIEQFVQTQMFTTYIEESLIGSSFNINSSSTLQGQ